jgi:hypothetical protein
MHGNTPYAGRADDETVTLSAEHRRALQRDVSAVAARTRDLLPDEFVVGSEVRVGTDGPTGMVAVQPPIGSAVSGGLAPDDGDEARDALVHQLAAGAALQVKRRLDATDAPAR